MAVRELVGGSEVADLSHLLLELLDGGDEFLLGELVGVLHFKFQ